MQIPKHSLSLLCTAITLACTSCAPSLNEVAPDPLAVPQSFPDTQENKAALAAMKTWQEFFPDPQLRALIESGLSSNQELRILEQEIAIANNETMGRQGEYWPKLGLGLEGGVERPGHDTSQGLADETTGVPNPAPKVRLGLNATWEIDIWKRLRNASQSAYMHALASVAGRKFAVTRWVAEVANTYYELMALDNQVTIIDSYVDIIKRVLMMIKAQRGAGRVTALPVKRFEAELLRNQVRQLELKQQVLTTQNKLNALVGRFPKHIERTSQNFASLTLAQINVGVPSALLEQRPDVQAAAYELESSKLNVASAKARFYPSLTIDAQAGVESFNMSHLVTTPASIFLNAMGGITAPLLNRNAIAADYFTANNRQIQAVYRYEQTLIQAFVEVVNQMNAVKNLRDAYEARAQQLIAMDDASKISTLLFQAARVDYVETLLTQREALETRLEMIESKKKVLGAYVGLYQALGGGWR